ncbi:diguanylate cyclase domain-containing protein [Inmirania thermothiophila]|uniref:diguanylate cyclase domain-containing protein n=1 Tax=Inmirania thermothiophila TaxID=1750597 RepID=UPI0014732973|nr:diguanylate cyclase [Inmirania thermothiophila]
MRRPADLVDGTSEDAALRQAAAVFEAAGDGILVTDARGVIVRVNPAFTRVTGYTPAEALGRTPRILRSGRHDRAFYDAMWQALRERGRWEGEVWNRRKDGEVYPQWLTITAIRDGDGRTTHYVAVFTEIGPLKAAEARLRRLAYRDGLTGLPNRIVLHDRLAQAERRARRGGRRFALLYVDLDGFKEVNDRLGHAAGDEVLREAAARLQGAVRGEDTVARIGGDEFALILEEADSVGAAVRAGREILRALARPWTVAGREVRVGASLGAAFYPDDAPGGETLLRCADAAMYRAKAAGGGCLRFYDGAVAAEAQARERIAAALSAALAAGGPEVAFRPRVRLADGVVAALEAVPSWRGPDGPLEDEALRLAAERTGLGEALDEAVAAAVRAAQGRWGGDVPVVSLAVGPRVLGGLAPRGALGPARLEAMLRLAELAAAARLPRGLAVVGDGLGAEAVALEALAAAGLAGLRLHPRPSEAGLRSAAAVAAALGLPLYGCGVGDEAACRRLAEAGCAAASGPLWGPPWSAAEVPARLRRGR